MPRRRPTVKKLRSPVAPIATEVHQVSSLPETNLTPDPKIGFTFSGGGSLIAFEIGAAKYLMDHLHKVPGVLTGTSTGSILASKLAENGGRRSTESVSAVAGMEALANGMLSSLNQVESLVRGIDRVDSLFQLRSELEEARGLLNDAFADHGDALRQTIGFIQAADRLASDSKLPTKIEQLSSILDPKGLEALLRTNVDPHKIATSGIKLRIYTVGLRSGCAHYITGAGELFEVTYTTSLKGIARSADASIGSLKDFIQAILSSSAIPIIFPPREATLRDGTTENFVDGGVREMIPVHDAHAMGATEIYAIYSSKTISRTTADYQTTGLLSILQRVMDIFVDEVVDNDIPPDSDAEFSGATITPIRPTIDLHNSLCFDSGLTAIAMDYGMMVAADAAKFFSGEAGPALAAALSAQIRDAITQLRYKAWNLEYWFSGLPNTHLGTDDPAINPLAFDLIARPTNRDVTAAHLDTLSEVRNVKAGIRELLKLRQQWHAFLPENSENWYRKLEGHYFSGSMLVTDPWSAYAAPGMNVPAADPETYAFSKDALDDPSLLVNQLL